MTVCVFGLWHLGSVTAACLASVGHDVVGLEVDKKTVSDLNQAQAPLFEPGLDDLLQAGIANGRLRFTTDIAAAAANAEVIWVAFDTPVDDDDRADVEFVMGRIMSVLPFLADGTVILVSSQMPVGSISNLEAYVCDSLPSRQLSFACSPENLRLGKALDLFLNPDRIVVGVRTEDARRKLEKLFLPVTDRIEWMSVESAEMTKHAINAFLATSVVFANEIASICELVGADAKEVERGLKSEQRIGPKAYLSPGGAFAGGTLARDIEFLKVVSHGHRLPIPLLESVKISNDEHKGWVRRKLKALFPDLKGLTISVWGLTYKPGTDTLRRSLAVELCRWLVEQGAKLRVHDPVVKELPPDLNEHAQRFDTALAALEGAQVLLIGTEWPEYRDVPLDMVAGRALVVLDPNRFLSHWGAASKLRYIAVGTPSAERTV